MFDTLASQIGAVFVALVCGFAFLKGDEPERLGAGAYILGWFATMLIQDDAALYKAQYGVMGIDVVMLLVLATMIWKSGRAWPVWACALQLLIVMSHVVIMLDMRPPANSFVTVVNIAAYGVLVCLAIGTFWAWQDRRAAGLE